MFGLPYGVCHNSLQLCHYNTEQSQTLHKQMSSHKISSTETGIGPWATVCSPLRYSDLFSQDYYGTFQITIVQNFQS